MEVNEEACKMGLIWGSHVIQKLQLQVIMGVRVSRDGNVVLKEDDGAPTWSSCEWVHTSEFTLKTMT